MVSLLVLVHYVITIIYLDDIISGSLERLNDDKCLKKETWTEICNKAGEHDEVGWDPKHNPRFDTLR